jgi:chromosome partitioning protein
MNTVMITAPADGVGRTTLAAWLGLQAEAAGAGLVVTLDANDDPALARWAREQKLRRPITGTWDGSCTPESLERLADEGVGLVLIDCPGPQDGARMAELLAVSDLALIAVRPRAEDLDAAGGLIDLVDQARKPFVFVVNQATDDEDMTAATAVSLAQHGPVSPVILPKCAELALPGLDTGEGGTDDRPVPGEDIARLWDYLRDRLARNARRADPGAQATDEPGRAGHAYDQDATFMIADMVYPCHVMEISAEGLLFSADRAPPAGERLRVFLPHLGQFDCEVTESRPDRIEVRLVIDEDRRGVLLEQVAALLGSSRQRSRTAAPPEAASEGAEARLYG